MTAKQVYVLFVLGTVLLAVGLGWALGPAGIIGTAVYATVIALFVPRVEEVKEVKSGGE